ncbi:MAG: 1-acyl-sn-glycerol-3-phosphate acyltransferase, partial [Acidimicrobiales bacterium]
GLLKAMGEPFLDRWRRRAVTIPAMLAATIVAVVGLPILAPAAVVADVVRGRWRLPTLRVYLFVLQYVINDSAEILAAPLLWLAGGFGTRLRSPASIARHERLMWWSANLLIHRADQLLGLQLDVDESAEACLAEGPVIVVSRHVSLLDASIPGLVCHRAGLDVRAVIMAELLADPGFDLLYGRLGSVFIPRDDTPRALAAINAMGAAASPATALVIFPEGRLFTDAVRDRSLDRLADRDPDRAARLDGLTNLLPPRPAGLFALLDAAPDADVVVLDHTGLDRLRNMADLLRADPVEHRVRVTAHRIDRAEVPEDEGDFVGWLDRLWCSLDERHRFESDGLA